MEKLPTTKIRIILLGLALLLPTIGGCELLGEACNSNSDCGALETCIEGSCDMRALTGEACDDDDDCWPGDVCTEGSCSYANNYPAQPNQPNAPSDDPSCNITELPSQAQLQLAEYGQVCTQWCWAATTTMVANYYGIQMFGCELVSAYTGQQCCNYQACGLQVCNQPASTQGMTAAMHWMGMQAQFANGALSETQLMRELALGRPVIVGYQNSFSGHVVVVTGYRSGPQTTFHVVDPYFGVFDNITYQSLRNGYQAGQYQWGVTWHGMSANGKGCPGW